MSPELPELPGLMLGAPVTRKCITCPRTSVPVFLAMANDSNVRTGSLFLEVKKLFLDTLNQIHVVDVGRIVRSSTAFEGERNYRYSLGCLTWRAWPRARRGRKWRTFALHIVATTKSGNCCKKHRTSDGKIDPLACSLPELEGSRRSLRLGPNALTRIVGLATGGKRAGERQHDQELARLRRVQHVNRPPAVPYKYQSRAEAGLSTADQCPDTATSASRPPRSFSRRLGPPQCSSSVTEIGTVPGYR